MNSDYEELEEELKKKSSKKKEQKVSGRSVFKLKEIIAKKGKTDADLDEEEKNGRTS